MSYLHLLLEVVVLLLQGESALLAGHSNSY